MVKVWLAADVDFVDFSGVQPLFIADMQMRDNIFPGERWFTDGIFCAPVDVCEQLEKLDSMISRDVEQTDSDSFNRKRQISQKAWKKRDFTVHFHSGDQLLVN